MRITLSPSIRPGNLRNIKEELRVIIKDYATGELLSAIPSHALVCLEATPVSIIKQLPLSLYRVNISHLDEEAAEALPPELPIELNQLSVECVRRLRAHYVVVTQYTSLVAIETLLTLQRPMTVEIHQFPCKDYAQIVTLDSLLTRLMMASHQFQIVLRDPFPRTQQILEDKLKVFPNVRIQTITSPEYGDAVALFNSFEAEEEAEEAVSVSDAPVAAPPKPCQTEDIANFFPRNQTAVFDAWTNVSLELTNREMQKKIASLEAHCQSLTLQLQDRDVQIVKLQKQPGASVMKEMQTLHEQVIQLMTEKQKLRHQFDELSVKLDSQSQQLTAELKIKNNLEHELSESKDLLETSNKRLAKMTALEKKQQQLVRQLQVQTLLLQEEQVRNAHLQAKINAFMQPAPLARPIDLLASSLCLPPLSPLSVAALSSLDTTVLPSSLSLHSTDASSGNNPDQTQPFQAKRGVLEESEHAPTIKRAKPGSTSEGVNQQTLFAQPAMLRGEEISRVSIKSLVNP